MDILLATSNPGKINRYAELLARLNPNIRLLVPADVGIDDIRVQETGVNEVENAKLKAKAYWEALATDKKMPCLAGDTGTYLENVLPDEQPGMYSRRISGAGDSYSLDGDETMAKHYQALCHKYGGKIPGFYLDGHCIYEQDHWMTMQNKRFFVLTEKVVGPISKGFPMLSMIQGKITGKYINEMSHEEYLQEMSPVSDALKLLLASLQ
ncbi:MAG: non-canonical purine NTP pyrophosphatase [Candidatus Abawacabacteria bacterium]|nr:non-canonical purine NTP pyrophosphatase [Candidatus Abawacabacteria bacterium]